MAQSLNTKVDLVMDATSFHGMNNYGKIMIGDRGFEYYNEKKMNDYIQIPWEEVDYVISSVMFSRKGSGSHPFRSLMVDESWVIIETTSSKITVFFIKDSFHFLETVYHFFLKSS